MRLRGLKRWGGQAHGSDQKGVGEGPHIDGRATGPDVEQDDVEEGYLDVEDVDRIMDVNHKGKGKAKCTAAMQVVEDVSSRTGPGMHERWVWKDAAMFLDINLGYQFN